MKIVYIFGKYSGPEQQLNIQQAEEAARYLWAKNIPCITPHLNTREFDGVAEYNTFLIGYIEILKRCDIALGLPGWDKSPGARTEHMVAIEEGIPVVYNFKGLEEAIAD